jgi:hypothetical protein
MTRRKNKTHEGGVMEEDGVTERERGEGLYRGIVTAV